MKRKVELKIKWLLIDLFTFFGWKPQFKKSEGQIRTLLFHGVCRDDEPLINGRFINLSRLEQLLSNFTKHFYFPSVDDLKSNTISTKKLNVVCTFDDGYKNNLDLALPLFEKYNVPIIIYCNNVPFHVMDLLDIANHWQPQLIEKFSIHFKILKSFKDLKAYCKTQNAETAREMRSFLWENLSIENKENSKRYWELLSDSDIVKLSENKLVSFGNHGAEHLSYPHLTVKEMHHDINSVDQRFTKISVELNSFAYPYSESTDATFEIVKQAGYQLQFSEQNKSENNPYLKTRLTINPFISTRNQLIAIVKGKY